MSDDSAEADESADEEAGSDTNSFTFLLVLGIVFGVAAIGVGGVGLYWTFVSPPVDDTEQPTEPDAAELLGGLACEDVDRQPASEHQTPYPIDRLDRSGDGVSSIDATADGEQIRIQLDLHGTPFNASASRFDGSPAPVVEVDGTAKRAVVVDAERTPFRLWIDVVADDGSVDRIQLDICSS